MQLVDLVVSRGKVVRSGGKVYREGQTFRAVPGKARLWVAIGRAQIDPAGTCAPSREALPKPTRADLRDVIREQRAAVVEEQPAEPQEPAEEQPTQLPAEQPAAQPAPRRRRYKTRDMTAEQA